MGLDLLIFSDVRSSFHLAAREETRRQPGTHRRSWDGARTRRIQMDRGYEPCRYSRSSGQAGRLLTSELSETRP
jgi:hypothetical protein